MSAPAPASTPTPPAAPAQTRLTPPRLLLAAAFAVVGFVAVWQGFGLAGFGTDVHIRRVFIAVALLLACGMPLVWPNMRPAGRVLAAVLGLGAASAAWWFLASSPDGGRSLREAAAERERLKQQLATPLLDDLQSGKKARFSLNGLEHQYPLLAVGLGDDFNRWVRAAELAQVEKYRQLPSGDLKTARELQSQVAIFGDFDSGAATRLEVAFRQWLARAVKVKKDELLLVRRNWDEFDNTAPGRLALAEADPESRPELVAAEEQWAEASVELMTDVQLKPEDAGLLGRQAWREVEQHLLALNSLNTNKTRFKEARRRILGAAHQDVEKAIATHLEAGRYNAAHGLARKHAVEWNATATILGVEEVKKLDSLREKCAALVKPDSVDPNPADETEIAPPPRTKP